MPVVKKHICTEREQPHPHNRDSFWWENFKEVGMNQIPVSIFELCSKPWKNEEGGKYSK